MKITGKIISCAKASAICGYRCCDQDPVITAGNARPTDYIMMYPGEYNACDTRQSHLMPVAAYCGGILARCAKECFDQSQCDPLANYKPLDCMSYPLMPKVDGGCVTLFKDDRCPLTETDISESHRETTQKRWQELAAVNPDVLDWLSSLTMDGYTQ
jgi:hypothetical protein